MKSMLSDNNLAKKLLKGNGGLVRIGVLTTLAIFLSNLIHSFESPLFHLSNCHCFIIKS